jgi:hypothetical protein
MKKRLLPLALLCAFGICACSNPTSSNSIIPSVIEEPEIPETTTTKLILVGMAGADSSGKKFKFIDDTFSFYISGALYNEGEYTMTQTESGLSLKAE